MTSFSRKAYGLPANHVLELCELKLFARRTSMSEFNTSFLVDIPSYTQFLPILMFYLCLSFT